MKVADGYAEMANSTQRALSTEMLNTSKNQDEASMDRLLEGLEESTARIEAEQKASPHKGQNINTFA